MLHHDKEETTKVRVIDLIFQSDLKEEDLYEFNIQDNKSIVRDFNFNTTIPSALSATMAVVAQNPDSINDMEGVTISSMNKLLTSRFSKPTGPFNNDEETYNARKKDEEKLLESAVKLYYFRQNVRHGQYNEEGTGIEKKNKPKPISIAKAMSSYKSIIDLIESLLVRYPLTDDNEKDFILDGVFKAGHKRKNIRSSKSSIIPLKFTCKMDGIGGIVIGNVFKINNKRLPIGYQGKDIAFMTHAESQTITSGQDWTTEISGQLLLLDIDENPKEYNGYILSPGDLVAKDVLETEISPTPNADIVRQALSALSYQEKKNDDLKEGRVGRLAENGDITEEMKNIIISILAKIAEIYPEVDIRITAGNDKSHSKSESSRHKDGNAVDITINYVFKLDRGESKFGKHYKTAYGDYAEIKKHAGKGTTSKLGIDYEGNDAPTVAEDGTITTHNSTDNSTKMHVDQVIATIDTIIKGFIGSPSSNGKLRYLNEYFYPTEHASAGHFHISTHPAGRGTSEGGPSGFGDNARAQNYTGAGKTKIKGSIDNLTLAEKTVKEKLPVWLVDQWTSVPGYTVNSYNWSEASTLLRGDEVLVDSRGNVMTGDPNIDFGAQNQGGQGDQFSQNPQQNPNIPVVEEEIQWKPEFGANNDEDATPTPSQDWYWYSQGGSSHGYWVYVKE